MAFSASAGRRRGATYGKKGSRSNGFTPASFEALLNRTPTKPKSSLSRIQSPAKTLSKSERFTVDEDLFDVPSSDHDEDEARLDGLLSTPSKKQAKQNKTPTPRRRKGSASISKPQTPVPHAQPRKRKRAEPDDVKNLEPGQKGTSRPRQPAANDSNLKKARFGSFTSRPANGSPEEATSTDDLQASENEAMSRNDVGRTYKTDSVDNMDVDEDAVPLGDTATVQLQTNTIGAADVKSDEASSPLTPPRQTSSDASSSSHHKATATPRQRKAWSSLLDDRASTPTNEIQNLKIATSVNTARQSAPKPAVPKPRLIDALRAAAPASDQDLDLASDDVEVPSSDPPEQPPKPSLERGGSGALSDTAVSSSQNFTRAPRVTYAQQRSYLSEPTQSLDELLSQPLDLRISPVASKPGKADGISRPQDQFDVDEDEENGGGRMRSIHELRIGGDTQRFDDQILTILDDLKDHSKSALSGRRGAMMSLAEKLCNPAFKARFIDRNHEDDVFGRCKDEKDSVCGVAVSCAVVVLLKDAVDPRSPAQILNTGIVLALSRMLNGTQDLRRLSRDRKTNMSRMAQQGVNSFVEAMLSSSVPSSNVDVVFSPQLIALTALELLLRRSRENGNRDILLETEDVSRIASILTDSTHVAFGSTKSGKDAFNARLSIDSALSTLESLTISPQDGSRENPLSAEQVNQIAGAARTILRLQAEDTTSIRCLVLRLTLNLSNGNKANSDRFADADVLGSILHRISKGFQSLAAIASDGEHPAEFDELLLSLGTLFNLAEMSADVRRIVARSYASILGDLVQMFNKQREKAREAESLAESQANVAFGYLAVLLGILCQNATGLQRIRAKLPKHKVTVLAEAIEEFTMHHQRVDNEDSSEIWAGFTGRLQSVADALKQVAPR